MSQNTNIGGTVQGAVGNFGPWGQAISAISTMGQDATSKSDSPLIASLGTGVFNPSSNLDFALNSDNSAGQRVGAMLLPGLAGFFDKKNEKNAPNISKEDPRQIERLLNLDRIAKNIQAGTDSATQTALQENQQNVAQTQSRLSQAVGGGGSLTNALLKAQASGQQQGNQAIAQGQGRLPFFMNLGQQLQNRVSQRALELDLLNRAQFMAEKAQADKTANINRQGAFGNAVAGGGFDALGQKGYDILGSFGNLGAGGGGPQGGINPFNNVIPSQSGPTTGIGNSQITTGMTEVPNLQGGTGFFSGGGLGGL